MNVGKYAKLVMATLVAAPQLLHAVVDPIPGVVDSDGDGLPDTYESGSCAESPATDFTIANWLQLYPARAAVSLDQASFNHYLVNASYVKGTWINLAANTLSTGNFPAVSPCLKYPEGQTAGVGHRSSVESYVTVEQTEDNKLTVVVDGYQTAAQRILTVSLFRGEFNTSGSTTWENLGGGSTAVTGFSVVNGMPVFTATINVQDNHGYGRSVLAYKPVIPPLTAVTVGSFDSDPLHPDMYPVTVTTGLTDAWTATPDAITLRLLNPDNTMVTGCGPTFENGQRVLTYTPSDSAPAAPHFIIPGEIGGSYKVLANFTRYTFRQEEATFTISNADSRVRPSLILHNHSGNARPGELVRIQSGFNGAVTWAVSPRPYSQARYTVLPTESSGSVLPIRISPTSGPGELLVSVRKAGTSTGDCSETTRLLTVGCGECTSTCDQGASATVQLRSLHLSFPLGAAHHGRTAGSIRLDAQVPSAGLASPGALILSSFAPKEEVRALYSNATYPRQIVSPDFVVDVHVISDYSYSLRYFLRTQAGTPGDNGLYPVPGAPFRTYTLSNPTESPSDYNTLEVLDSGSGGTGSLSRYSYNPATLAWTLLRGMTIDGSFPLHKEAVVTTTNNGLVTKTCTIFDPANNQPKLTRAEVWDAAGKLVQEIVDPGGLQLTTTHTYDPVTGDLLTTVDPTGNWTKWVYDAQRRVTHEYHAWLDTPLANYTQARLLQHDYTPIVGSSDSNHADDAHLPRITTESINGVTISRTWHIYQRNAQSGIRTVTTKRAVNITGASDTPAWDDAANEFETVVYKADSFTDPFAGRISSRTGSDGQTQTYSYDTGVLGGTTDTSPANWTFTTGGNNSFVRTQRMESVTGNPNGVSMRNTVTDSVVDLLGRPRLTQVREVSTQTILDATGYLLDGHGRPETTRFANGTFSTTTYECCGPFTSIDTTGVTTTYYYDRLGRPYQEIRRNRNNVNVVLTRVYDPIGAVKSLTMANDPPDVPSQTTTTLYDAAGRVYEQLQDPLGSRTRTAYPSPLETRVFGPLQSDIANPTEADSISIRYLDGRLKSLTGRANTPALSHEYATYTGTVFSGARLVHKVYQLNSGGAQTGARSDTYTDALGRVCWTDVNSSPTHRLRSQNTYSAGNPSLLLTTSHGYSTNSGASWTSMSGLRTSTTYDELNQPLLSGIDVSGTTGVPDENSTDRISKTTTGFVLLDGAWWSESKQYFYPLNNNPTSVLASTRLERLTGLGGADANGVLAGESRSIDRHGNTTKVCRYIDRANRKETTITDVPDSVENAVEVRIAGVLASSTDTYGLTTTYTHDNFDRLLEQTNASGTAKRSYDSEGRIKTTTDVHNKVTNYAEFLDNTALPTKVIEPGDRITYTEYDALGRPVKVWGNHATPTWTEYDDHGRVAKLHTYQDAGLDFTQATWPASAGSGQVTEWVYDPLSGLVTKKKLADASSHDFTYDHDGRESTRIWARKIPGSTTVRVTATHTYNTVGDRYQTVYNDGTPTWWAIYQRDGVMSEQNSGPGDATAEKIMYGRDPAFAYELSYEARNLSNGLLTGLNTIVERQPGGSDTSLRGRLQKLYVTPALGGFGVAWDNLGRIQYIGNTSIKYHEYEYLPNTPVVHVMRAYAPTYGPGLRFSTTYNRGLGYRLESVVNANGAGGSMVESVYAYDDAGRITKETRADDTYWQHGYNHRDELTSGVKHAPLPGDPEARVPGLNNTYTYDHAGNWVEWMNGGDLQGANTRTFTYSRNDLNQYTSVSPVDPYDVTGEAAASANVTIDGVAAQRNGLWFRGEFNAANDTTAAYPANVVQVTENGVPAPLVSVNTFVGPNNTEFDYDDDGNLTQDARWDYTWDAENRCVKIQTRADLPGSVPRVTLEFTYDAAGRRIRKLVKDGAGAVVFETRHLWHGNHLIADVDSNRVSQRGYVWGLDLSGRMDGAAGVGGLLMVYGFTGDYTLFNVAQDGRGNVVGLYDMVTGAKWREYEYDGFGRMVAERKWGGPSHLDVMPFRYSTRMLDPETGLLAYHYRLYSPQMGRWLSRDPIGEAGGLHLYGMVGNNPVNYFDPLGLREISLSALDPNWASAAPPTTPIRSNMVNFEFTKWGVHPVTGLPFFVEKQPGMFFWSDDIIIERTPLSWQEYANYFDVDECGNMTPVSSAEAGRRNRAGTLQALAAMQGEYARFAGRGTQEAAMWSAGGKAIGWGVGKVWRGVRGAWAARLARQAAAETEVMANTSRVAGNASSCATSCAAKGGVPRIYCFAAGTKVATPEGERNIEDIKQGDLVLAYDFELGKMVERPIKELVRSATEHWYELKVADKNMKVTGGHPFWVESQQDWVYARDLRVGMTLRNPEGSVLPIQSIRFIKLDTPEPTFNFEVEQHHNYFAGSAGSTVLVHNTNPFDIHFSRPPGDINASQVFTDPNSAWKGRTLGDAVAEARRLGRLPDGLTLNATRWGAEETLVAANNRTLWIAQQARLRNVSVAGLESGSVAKTVTEHIARNGGPFCPP